MAATKKVSILLSGKETVSTAANKAAGSMDELGTRGKSAFEGLGGAAIVANQALELAAKAAQAIAAVYEQMKLGAQAKQIEQAFVSMARSAGQSADKMLVAMQRASAGTVDATELMAAANRAMLFSIPVDKLDELMAVARASATATGESVQQMFADIVTGIGRASPMILDNLGLTLRVGEANLAYAESLGIAVTEMTAADKKMAILNATLEAGEALMIQVGDAATELTDLEKIQQMETAWSNLTSTLQMALNDTFSPAIELVTTLFNKINDTFELLEQRRDDKSILSAAIEGTGTLEDFERAYALQQQNVDFAQATLQREKELRDQQAEIFGVQSSYYQAAQQRFIGAIQELGVQENIEADIRMNLYDRRAAAEAEATAEAQARLEAERQAAASATEAADAMAAQAKYWQTFVNQAWGRTNMAGPATAGGASVSMGAIGLEMIFGDFGAGLDVLGGRVEDLTDKPWDWLGDQVERTAETFYDLNTGMRSGVTGAWDQFGAGYGGYGRPGEYTPEAAVPAIDYFADFGLTVENISSGLGGFSGAIIDATSAAGAYGLAMLAAQVALDAFLDTIGPALNEMLVPVVEALQKVGVILAQAWLPILNRLTPALQLISIMFNVVVSILQPFIDAWSAIISFVLTLLLPAWQILATLVVGLSIPFQILGGVIQWIGDWIKHMGNTIATFIHNLTHPFDRREYGAAPGSLGGYIEDVVSGVNQQLADIWAVTTGDLTLGEPTDYSGVGGDNTTVYRPPDIYFYQTFNGPIIGETGLDELGRLIADSLIEYTDIGGNVNVIIGEGA